MKRVLCTIGALTASSLLLLGGCDDQQQKHLEKAGDDIADSAKNFGDSAAEEYDKAKDSIHEATAPDN